MVMYANEVDTKEEYILPIKLTTTHTLSTVVYEMIIFYSVI